MRILIIGGTRLLGKAVVGELHLAGHDLTVLSRAIGSTPSGVRFLRYEREDGLRQLDGSRFDLVLDFLAYDGPAVRDVLSKSITAKQYVLISSTWMLRLRSSVAADAEIADPDPVAVALLPAVTRRYLLGKLEAESTCVSFRRKGRATTILRLPIFLDAGEHTGRLAFYCERVLDGEPVICVDGGTNLSQLLWVRDAAPAIAKWSEMAGSLPIWEALPSDQIALRDVVGAVARGLNARVRLADIPSQTLERDLSQFLDMEPLWRERPFAVSSSNIFRATGMRTTPVADWLSEVSAGYENRSRSPLRSEEIAYLRGRGAC